MFVVVVCFCVLSLLFGVACCRVLFDGCWSLLLFVNIVGCCCC